MDLPSHAPISFAAMASWQTHAAARDSSSTCLCGQHFEPHSILLYIRLGKSNTLHITRIVI